MKVFAETMEVWLIRVNFVVFLFIWGRVREKLSQNIKLFKNIYSPDKEYDMI